MRRPVRWTREALDDVAAQADHIAGDNLAAARRVAAALRAAAARLGQRHTGRPGRVHGTYEKLVARLPYVIAYALEADGDAAVVILRVIHTSRDWPAGGWPR